MLPANLVGQRHKKQCYNLTLVLTIHIVITSYYFSLHLYIEHFSMDYIQNVSIVLFLHIDCVQKKYTHSRFHLYLRGKCLDLHKISRECL